jgi:hypothetical protein
MFRTSICLLYSPVMLHGKHAVDDYDKSALNRARNCFSARPADHGVT